MGRLVKQQEKKQVWVYKTDHDLISELASLLAESDPRNITASDVVNQALPLLHKKLKKG